jgi:RNA polymerase sigma-70 factor (ECF subfamily)
MTDVQSDSTQTRAWLEKIGRGDQSALGLLLSHHRDRVRAFVEVRLDACLRARMDPSDVVQETQLEVIRRMDDYLRRRPMPFHLWVRRTAYQRLLDLRRDHRRRQRRSVDREVALPEGSSLQLAQPLLARGSSPSAHLQARENTDRIARAVAQLPEADREILLMRHVEELPYEEIACLLAIEPPAARKRYGRALIRLQEVLTDNGLMEPDPP